MVRLNQPTKELLRIKHRNIFTSKKIPTQHRLPLVSQSKLINTILLVNAARTKINYTISDWWCVVIVKVCVNMRISTQSTHNIYKWKLFVLCEFHFHLGSKKQQRKMWVNRKWSLNVCYSVIFHLIWVPLPAAPSESIWLWFIHSC